LMRKDSLRAMAQGFADFVLPQFLTRERMLRQNSSPDRFSSKILP
jgi:hypothetical protein